MINMLSLAQHHIIIIIIFFRWRWRVPGELVSGSPGVPWCPPLALFWLEFRALKSLVTFAVCNHLSGPYCVSACIMFYPPPGPLPKTGSLLGC
jgi:hypothetical protein